MTDVLHPVTVNASEQSNRKGSGMTPSINGRYRDGRWTFWTGGVFIPGTDLPYAGSIMAPSTAWTLIRRCGYRLMVSS